MSNLVLRNYVPKDATLKGLYAPPSLPAATSGRADVDGGQLPSQTEISLVPRHPNSDLKRDLMPMMALLERRTQRAIIEIVRERLVTGKSSTNTNTMESIRTSATSSNSSSGGTSLNHSNSKEELDEEYTGPVDASAAASALRRAGEGSTNDNEDDEDGELAKIRAIREQHQRKPNTLSTKTFEGGERRREEGIKSAGATLTDETLGVAVKRRRYDSDDE